MIEIIWANGLLEIKMTIFGNVNFTFSNITLMFPKVEKQFQPKNAYHFCNNESYVHESDRNFLINDWYFLI